MCVDTQTDARARYTDQINENSKQQQQKPIQLNFIIFHWVNKLLFISSLLYIFSVAFWCEYHFVENMSVPDGWYSCGFFCFFFCFFLVLLDIKYTLFFGRIRIYDDIRNLTTLLVIVIRVCVYSVFCSVRLACTFSNAMWKLLLFNIHENIWINKAYKAHICMVVFFGPQRRTVRAALTTYSYQHQQATRRTNERRNSRFRYFRLEY